MDSSRQLGLAYSGKNKVFKAWVQSTLANPRGGEVTVAQRLRLLRIADFGRMVRLETGGGCDT